MTIFFRLAHTARAALARSQGHTRHNFDAKVTPFGLTDTYWPAFKASVVDGGALGVMYEASPSCGNPNVSLVTRNLHLQRVY